MLGWFEGTIVEDLRVPADDRGFTLGDGLFETMRAGRDAVPHLARHLERLRRGAAALAIPVPLADAAIEEGCRALLGRAGLEAAAIRLVLTRGRAPRGLRPPRDPRSTLLLTVGALPPAKTGVRAIGATVTRRNEHSPLSGLKVPAYLDAVLALREAEGRGADEALLRNTAGRWACATAANLLVVRGGRLLTPPVGEGALPGITRALIPGVEEAPIERLDGADEILLTSSLQGVVAVVRLDDREVGGGAPGPVFERVRRRLAGPG